ncbi:cytochrome c oxidase assembly protein [Aliidiomarina sedimenti]|nr:cytochrome c oxidase assembly protein [Aliidiomarina sedimenti]
MRVTCLILLLCFAMTAQASSSGDIVFGGELQQYLASALTLGAIIGVCLLYLRGAKRTPVKRGQFWLFQATLVVTIITILGPLDDWAARSSALHMTQHMMLMVVIAPMFALSKPLAQFYVAFAKWGKPLWDELFKVTRYPMVCAYLHGFMIWFWHIPVFYMLALDNPWIHGLEHLCFLVTAVWFWWACLYASPRKTPFALLALLLTLMHTGFLGALLTFAGSPLYGEARHLGDQQLAGLLMWVLGGIPYIAASLWAGNRWYKHLQRRIANA